MSRRRAGPSEIKARARFDLLSRVICAASTFTPLADQYWIQLSWLMRPVSYCRNKQTHEASSQPVIKPRTETKTHFQTINAIKRSAMAPRTIASQDMRKKKCNAQIKRNQP